MKKQVVEAAKWLTEERQRLGLSISELADKANDMAHDFRWEAHVPDETEIAQLEAQEFKAVPRWFKLLRYALARAASPETESLTWLGERNYYYSHDPLKMSRPYVFEDEARFINSLDRLNETQRSALRAFATNYATRLCYDTKENYAEKFLEKFDIAAQPIDEQERELVTRFRKLSADKQDAYMRALRQATA